MATSQKIIPSLFFSGNVKTEAIIAFYSSVFKDFEVLYQVALPAGPAEGQTLARVKMNGTELVLFDVKQGFEFSEGLSLSIDCMSQDEVDYYWEKLISGGGKAIECGWLQDKYGVFWQIVPTRLMDMIRDADSKKAAAAFNTMLTMQKIDTAKLNEAFGNPN